MSSFTLILLTNAPTLSAELSWFCLPICSLFNLLWFLICWIICFLVNFFSVSSLFYHQVLKHFLYHAFVGTICRISVILSQCERFRLLFWLQVKHSLSSNGFLPYLTCVLPKLTVFYYVCTNHAFFVIKEILLHFGLTNNIRCLVLRLFAVGTQNLCVELLLLKRWRRIVENYPRTVDGRRRSNGRMGSHMNNS